MDVPALHEDAAALRPRRRADLAPLGQLPIPDLLTTTASGDHAISKVLNSQIQKIKSMACRFRNLENFKTAIYFHCGGLDLYPC